MEVTLKLSDLVGMQSKRTNLIYIFHKSFGKWSSSCQNFNQYNNNNLEEKDEEEKQPINIEFTEQKADPYNDENAIDFNDQM